MTSLLVMKGIVKRFPGLLANDNIDFEVAPGEVHALLGENGAGKSTLMNILSGLYVPDAGEILLRGKRVTITSPKEAIELGIGMVHQHFMLIPAMTAAENIILGLRSPKEPWLGLAEAETRIRALSERYGLSVNPRTKVSELSVGEQQRVELLKALYRDADLLILDEPTAVLTPEEAESLFAIIHRLAGEGATVIFISHKLKEVMRISDRVTILRHGRIIGTVVTAEATSAQLATMMVGREVLFEAFPKSGGGSRVMAVKNVTYVTAEGKKALEGVSFDLRESEVVGIAGVDGNGQSQLARIVTGLLPPASGRIELLGQDMTGKTADCFIRAGVAHIPEDRNKMGLSGDMSIAENLVFKSIDQPPFSSLKGFRLHHAQVREHALKLAGEYDIRSAGVNTFCRNLSGGNRQKVILARELSQTPVVLVAVHPTRGLDVGATDFIHRQIIDARDSGCAVLLISSDLDEVLRLSDRILCIYEGKIMAELSGKEPDLERIGLLMAGKGAEE